MLKGLRLRLAVIFTAFTGLVLGVTLGAALYLSIQQITSDHMVWFSHSVDVVVSTIFSNDAAEERVNFNADLYVICVYKDGQPLTEWTQEPQPAHAEAGARKAVARTYSPEEKAVLYQQVKQISQETGLVDWVVDSYQFQFDYPAAGTDASPLKEAEKVVAIAPSGGDASPEATTPSGDMTFGVQGFFAEEGSSSGVIEVIMGPIAGTNGVFEADINGTKYRATYFSLPVYNENTRDFSLYEAAILEDLAPQSKSIYLRCFLFGLLFLGGLGLLFLANWVLAKLVLRPTAEGIRRQTEFVAAASHELRSPLAVIRSSLSAAEVADNANDAQKYRTAADTEAERMSHLVDDLLLLSGGDAGSWAYAPGTVDLDTLLIDASETYQPLAKQQQVALELDLPQETLPKVKGDNDRLRQILNILLDNALQYAPQDTVIKLSAQCKKGKVAISVADSGKGIPPEERERVFVRFYRADQSRHAKKNFGLGLSVAQELACLHGGSISVGDTPGGGATFTLTLPLSK